MKIIDFRARPNTKAYMELYPGTHAWDVYFRCPKPEPGTLEDFISALDKTGISQAVFTGRRSPLRKFSNETIAECVKAYPDRLFGFAGIDPTEGHAAVREIESAVKKLGMKGIALDPHHIKVYPDDRLLYPLYYKCAELDVPVIFTMGPLVGKWADPQAVDNIADEIPGLKIVCSHGVWPQVTELIALAYRRENVYLESSIYEFLPGAQPIFEAANTILQDKIIYASGFPFRPLDDIKRFLEYPFDEEVVEKLVYRNAARLLKIENG
jgi:predicted TIM-barrel fold metal-dependent hydrolase